MSCTPDFASVCPFGFRCRHHMGFGEAFCCSELGIDQMMRQSPNLLALSQLKASGGMGDVGSGGGLVGLYDGKLECNRFMLLKKKRYSRELRRWKSTIFGSVRCPYLSSTFELLLSRRICLSVQRTGKSKSLLPTTGLCQDANVDDVGIFRNRFSILREDFIPTFSSRNLPRRCQTGLSERSANSCSSKVRPADRVPSRGA
jgi:hypothetical protein